VDLVITGLRLVWRNKEVDMRKEDKERAEKLAEEHWEWFQKVVGHIAKDFFVHGYKHGTEKKGANSK